MRTLLSASQPALLAIIIPGLICLHSCSSTADNSPVIVEFLNESVMNANKDLTWEIEKKYMEFDDKKSKIETVERTKKWDPVLLFIKYLSKEVRGYITGMEEGFVKEIGDTEEEIAEARNGGTKTKDFFIEKRKAYHLHKCLESYKKNILDADSQLSKSLRPVMDDLTSSLNEPGKKNSTFDQFYFKNTNAFSALALLHKFKNVALSMENTALDYINHMCTSYKCFSFDVYNPVVAQSSKIVSPGEEIVITAGVAAFTTENKSDVFILGKKVQAVTGISVSRIKAPGKPGEYHIPVSIEYADREGRKQARKFDIEYKVVDCLQ
jgi:hypothetical protein